MWDEKIPSKMAGSGEVPVPIPPVDESWSGMRGALDVRMPVAKPFYVRPRFLGAVVCGAVLTAVVVKGIHHSAGRAGVRGVERGVVVKGEQVGAAPGGAVTGKAGVDSGRVRDVEGKVIGDGGDVARVDGQVAGKVGEAVSGAGAGTGKRGGEAEPRDRLGDNGGEFATIRDERSGVSKAGSRAGKAGNKAGKAGNRVDEPGSKAGKVRKTGSEVAGTGVKTGEVRGEVGAGRVKGVEWEVKGVKWQGKVVGVVGVGAMGVGDLRFLVADTLLRKWKLKQGGPIPDTRRPAMAHARYMTAGLSLDKNFALGQQQSYPVGVNGNPGTLTDYLPSAHVRAYSGNWDLQLDVRFITPQYTRSEAIDSSGGDSSTIFPFQGYRQYNVFILKKLYYSQIAVGADREVVKGLWLGAGVSFGRLTSAYGSQEILMKATNPGVRDTVYSFSAVNAKYNDTAYNRLSRSDWRLMLNAEYRWHRWTVGFRYERSLNPYLSVQGDGSKGTERNQQFSLHLGYELWQGRR